MKKESLTLLCLAASLLTLSLPIQATIDNEHSKIALSSKKWVDTYNSNDWHALAKLFTQDATMMPPNSKLVKGREAIANWQAKNESGFRIAFDIQEIHVSGNIAYVRGSSCVFIPLGDGEHGVDVGKFLEVRKKQVNGEWLIHADIFNSDGVVGSDLLPSCPFLPLNSAN
jgi:uncharacterized protein (TIGR02246 family)